MLRRIFCIKLLIIFFVFFYLSQVHSEGLSEYWEKGLNQTHINIKSLTGKFYASIVLLFNENPHFINLIQEDNIPADMMQKEGFHIKEYNNYLLTIKDADIKKMAEIMLNIYLHPNKFNEKTLYSIEDDLVKLNIILRFSKVNNEGTLKIALDYCIFGRKEPINIIHPLFEIKEKIFNIQPFIYYDEFSTSNSTFYFDMIYINPEEVHNDYLIAKYILQGKSVDSMFFVGARVTKDIKYCISRAFVNSKNIKKEILKMFEIHELTHKILNNHHNSFDQVTGEQVALASTIYSNVYLGLSVLFSYLDYNRINPHRIAAMNYIKFIANRLEKISLLDDPSSLKYLPPDELKKLSKENFESVIKALK